MKRQADQHGEGQAVEEAAGWVLRLEAPDATEADWLALQAWLHASPGNRAAYERMERVSADLADAAPELLEALSAQTLMTRPERRRGYGRRPHVRAHGRLRAWPAAGGLAAAACAVAVVVLLRPPMPAPTDIYQTAKGQSRSLQLADGSRIRLNSASRLSVRLDRDVRHVELVEGEAAFDVAKDPDRPFVIAVGDRNVRVVGTEFDVLRHDGRLRVTVRRGIVAVQVPDAAPGSEPVLLKVGDQLDHAAGARVSTVERVDPDAAFAWKDGELIYKDRPLAEVVEDLNRYYATPVRVSGPAGALRFSGVIKLDGEDTVVRRLQGFLHLAADRGPNGVDLRLWGEAS